MMPLTRRVSLPVALFYLFTSAATASAECAWVLWEDTFWPGNTTTEPVHAYSAKRDCDHGLADVLASFSGPSIVEKDTKCQTVSVMVGKSVTGYRYVCLPDNIDPRGGTCQ